MWNIAPVVNIDPSSTSTMDGSSSSSTMMMKNKKVFLGSLFLSLLSLVAMQLPYYAVLVFYTTTKLIHHVATTYWAIQLNELFTFDNNRRLNENTYYGRLCTMEDSTASSPEELIVDNPSDAVHGMLKHGVALFPNLIEPDTARELRETIIDYNDKVENFGVIANKNRNSYGILLDQHPSVRKATRQILSNPLLKEALPKIIGHDPAIYKFHAITSSVGAKDQYWHSDVVSTKSALGFARTFVPLYSLFIPLQNTTNDMGATQMCPGSHICTEGYGFCEKHSFQMASPGMPNGVWPAGWGALMNQQTHHRGRRHINEESGPRVLFILAFAPRPSEHDTRSLSLGGSYAQHWTQWGHTVSDLRESWTHMKWRWTTLLRSVGVWKWPNFLSKKGSERLWGWTFPQTALIQMATGSYDSKEELEEYLEEKWFTNNIYIPQWLLAEVPDENSCEDEDHIWFCWFLATVEKTKEWLEQVMVYTSLGLFLFVVLFSRKENYLRNLGKYLLIPTVLAWIAHESIIRHVDSTTWARKTISRDLYQPFKSFYGPSLPATLPTRQDVLMLKDFQSDYLASYTTLFDVAHPGNAAWKTSIAESAVGYSTLNEEIKATLCHSVLRWNKHHRQSRILTKNHINEWAEAPYDMAFEFAHSQLLREDNQLVEHVLRQLDYLFSESRFGKFRETAMALSHLPLHLRSLEKHLLRTPVLRQQKTLSPASSVHIWNPNPLLLTMKNTVSAASRQLTPRGIPPLPLAEEPYYGAWLEVGDFVDGRYKNEHDEWYKGVIESVSGWASTYHVRYADGEFDEDLCRTCVRPFQEYQVGETVEAFSEDDIFEVIILDVLDDSRIHVAEVVDGSDNTTRVWEIETTNIRRKRRNNIEFNRVYELGEYVEAVRSMTGKDKGSWELGVVVYRTKKGGKYQYGIDFEKDGEYKNRMSDFVRPLY